MKRTYIKKITTGAILIALALALSLAERLLPIGAVVPLPGIRLGLANIVTMLALFYIGTSGALVILVSRCLIAALFSGITSLLFSLTGGLLALFVMLLVMQWMGRGFSVFGVSIAGAAAHNTGQILAASLLLGENLIFTYLPILLLTGIVTGIITAATAGLIFTKLEKNGTISKYFEGAKMRLSKGKTT